MLMGVKGALDHMGTALEQLAVTLGCQVPQQELTNSVLCQLLELLPRATADTRDVLWCDSRPENPAFRIGRCGSYWSDSNLG